MFTAACQQLDIDIISLDMSVRLPFYFKAANISSAIARGIVFELTYSTAIRG